MPAFTTSSTQYSSVLARAIRPEIKGSQTAKEEGLFKQDRIMYDKVLKILNTYMQTLDIKKPKVAGY